MPTLNFVDFLLEYPFCTQKVIKIPLIDSIYLNILQALKLNFAKINKLRVQIRSGDGGGNIFHKSISGGTFIKHQRQLTFEDQGSIEKE